MSLYPLRLALAGLLGTALAGCQAPAVRPAGEGASVEACTDLDDTALPLSVPVVDNKKYDSDYLTAAQFRTDYPVPEKLAQVMDAYDGAYARLLEKAAGGLYSPVRLMDGTGGITTGSDEYIRGTPRKYREVRAQYETIVVGTTICTRTPGGPFACSPTEFDDDTEFVWHQLVPAAIVSVTERPMACGGETCTAYTVVQAGERVHDGRQLVVASPSSDHLVFRIVLKPDGSAFSVRDAHWFGGKLDVEAINFFTCDTRVTPFDLPPH